MIRGEGYFLVDLAISFKLIILFVSTRLQKVNFLNMPTSVLEDIYIQAIFNSVKTTCLLWMKLKYFCLLAENEFTKHNFATSAPFYLISHIKVNTTSIVLLRIYSIQYIRNGVFNYYSCSIVGHYSLLNLLSSQNSCLSGTLSSFKCPVLSICYPAVSASPFRPSQTFHIDLL